MSLESPEIGNTKNREKIAVWAGQVLTLSSAFENKASLIFLKILKAVLWERECKWCEARVSIES